MTARRHDLAELPDCGQRIRVADVARLTGFSVRIVQMMAAAGELPGALQRKPGGRWTFDGLAVRRWIKQREDASCRTISIGAAKPGGRAFSPEAANIDAAYAQALGLKPAGASRKSVTR